MCVGLQNTQPKRATDVVLVVLYRSWLLWWTCITWKSCLGCLE